MACSTVHKTLYLLRHGSTGLSGKFIGSTDIPISQDGAAEIHRSAGFLVAMGIQKVFCSPMLRCRQTAQLLSLPCTIEYKSSLQEIDFGAWEKKSFQEICGEGQSLIDVWISDYAQFGFPGGESIQQFLNRLSSFLKFLPTVPESSVLLITHGGVIRHLLCLLLEIPVTKYLSFDVKTGRYCSLEMYETGAVLTGFNL